MLTSTAHSLSADVGRLLDPDEGCGMRVPLSNVALDLAARTVSKEPPLDRGLLAMAAPSAPPTAMAYHG
jgi:hypothetical protein